MDDALGPKSDATASPAAVGSEGLDRILTVPNVITAVRLACLPVFAWMVLGTRLQVWAAVLLGALGATDWLDGWYARRFHQVSNVGKVIDPVTDRVLVGTAVIIILVRGAVPLWFGLATLSREVLVSAATIALAALGAARIDVLWVGKAGTFALMFAYPAFLVSHGHAHWQTPFHVFAWVVGAIGLLLAWVAAASYVPLGRRALVAGRSGRRTAPADS